MAVNLSFLGGAGWQFFDDNGVPLVGGKLITYIAGTTTPAVTYTNSTGNFQNTNPIILDSAGRVPEEIWLTENTLYKFVLKDADDVQIWSKDDIAGGNDFTLILADLANTSNILLGDALIGFKQSNSNGVLPNTVGKTVHTKLQELLTPQDFGAVGNGLTNDLAAFNYLESVATGQIINLLGKDYVVGAYPTGNTYVNGKFIVGATTYDAAQDKATISSLTDTGGIDAAYTGGVNNTPTISGRTNNNTRAVIASQNCRSQNARSINVASIYSWAYGNVSGNYSARQCVAGAPQSVNSASEECVVYGFRGANIVGHYSGVWNGGGGNFSARFSDASGRHAVNVASVSAMAGFGGRALLSVIVATGVVTGVTIVDGGIGYKNGASLAFYDRITLGAGAAATITVDGNGTVTGIVLTNGGSGYSDSTDATVDTSGNYSANIATTNFCKTTEEASANLASNNSQVFSLRSANVATNECVVAETGQTSGNFASSTSTATGSRATNLASSGSRATGAGAVVLSGNICEAAADGAVVFGRRTINNQTRSIAFGDSATGDASTANRKFHLFSSGNMSIAGTLTQSAIFTDYAEYFENVSKGKLELGVLVSLEGRKVKPAQPGDDILGVVSATASIAAGDSPFQWAKRYLTGEFGELLYQEIPDPDWQPMIKDLSWSPTDDDKTMADCPLIPNPKPQSMISVPIENPEYNPDWQNVPRSERSDEWTCVGLLGQVHVRVDANIQVGDFVKAGANGIGVKSDDPTNMRCMEIRKDFDANKGYAVAFCLLK